MIKQTKTMKKETKKKRSNSHSCKITVAFKKKAVKTLGFSKKCHCIS